MFRTGSGFRSSRVAGAIMAAVIGASCTGSSGVSTVERDPVDTSIDETDAAGSAVGESVPGPDGASADDEPPADSGGDPVDGSGDDSGDDAVGALDWGRCESSNPLVDTECATLQVPLDYDDPGGRQIEIAVARAATASPEARIGSLVFNPGGPGGSGIEFLTQAAVITSPAVAEHFDLVSFDPRGVGASTAVACDVEIDDEITLLEAGDDAGFDALVEEAADSIDDCDATTLEIAPHLGTDNAARDLDRLRVALGDDGLTFVGYSYGTRLGATYAELFADNVRALVLDAGVKPTTDPFELDLGQAEGFDRALTNFADACDADVDCLLRDLGPTLDVIEGLRAELDEVATFDTDDPDRVLTRGEFDLGILAALYSKDAWPFLAQALFTAETDQDGTLLQVLGDGLVGRRPDGTYDNSGVANTFINCADSPERLELDTIRANADEAAARSRYFDGLIRANTGCFGIPPTDDPLTIGPADGAPPILVIGNTGDPATPYDWSVALADELSSAVLYTVEAEGHTAYGTIDCVTGVVDGYLVDLVVPTEPATCSDNETADFFVPAGESEVDLVVALFDCLRENGADVPEVSVADVLADPTGEVLGEALDPTDPAFLAAAQACQEILFDLQGSL